MFPYISSTPQDEKDMLEVIGLDSLEELFSDIPNNLKLNRELDLPKGASEIEVLRHLNQLAKKNKSVTDLVCFLGAGAYDHYIPTVIDHLLSRSEYYTSYTPYQPEVSQGTLQYLFEFQTLLCEITGMDVANASLYDGGTAAAEAALMAASYSRRKEVIVSETIRPETIKILKTYLHLQDIELKICPMKDGVTDLDKLDEMVSKKTAAVIIQSPNFFGFIENIEKASEIAHKEKKVSMIMSTDPISLGILKRPSELGVDVVIGEGQGLGVSLSYGGPYLGFIAAKDAYVRKLPGRIVGETVDLDGKRSYVLTLTAREQHIRREKATSNICSNQGLNTLAATIYLVSLGKKGLREVALQSTQKAHYAYNKILSGGKFEPLFDQPFFKEFPIKSKSGSCLEISDKLLEEGILGGYCLGNDFEGMENSTLIAVTEKRTKEEIDKLASVLEEI